jgi:hypothetical protein
MKNQRSGHHVLESMSVVLSHYHLPAHHEPLALSLSFDKLRLIGNSNRHNTNPTPFGLSLSFDKLRMIGNSNRLRGHFDRLSANGVGWDARAQFRHNF